MTTLFPNHVPPAVPATITGGEGSLVPGTIRARVPSVFIRNMDKYKLLIPGRHLQLLDTVGQGRGKLSNCPFIVVVVVVR